MLRYLTAGESHGKCLLAIIDGIPAGLKVDEGKINRDLIRRMQGYGRGKRMSIEVDRADILSGLRKNVTIGSPITIRINNIDYSIDSLPRISNPRPGHADLAGMLKINSKDARDILERASARETAVRVAVGAVTRILLEQFDIDIVSHVTRIGGISAKSNGLSFSKIRALQESSPVRCVDTAASEKMCKAIDTAMVSGNTLGGIFEVLITGAPAGLGSYVQWDRKINANLARAIMSIQAIKWVGFGLGCRIAETQGSLAHDEIFYDKKNGFFRKTNNAGGIEGGMTNGEDIIIRAAMKPIATLKKPLNSVDIDTRKAAKASVERSDVTAVPAAGVVAEAVSAIEIANAMIEKFGGDSISEMHRNYKSYLTRLNLR